MMTTVEALLTGTDLADIAARGVLADALDEAGRVEEAALLRGDEKLKLADGVITLAVNERCKLACDRAAGRTPFDQSEERAARIIGAKKDLNSKGNGPEWYRMVWRGGQWQYVSEERLPRGKYLASERRATVYGDVWAGELVCSHDYGALVDAVWLVTSPDREGKVLVQVEFAKRRDGSLKITLPTGDVVIVPDPRKK